MFLLAVIAEPLAVIRQQHDRRAIVELMGLQILHQPADDLVGVGDLAVVRARTARSAPAARTACAARRDAGTETTRDVPIESSQCSAIDSESPPSRCTWPIDSSGEFGGISPSKKSKPLTDAGFLAQHVGRDDAAGGEAALAQHLRQEPFAGVDGEPHVVADARLERQPAGEDGGVRRQRLRRVRIRALEDDAVRAPDASIAGVRTLGIAVDGQVIGAQRVDRDEDDRPADGRRGARVTPAADGGEAGAECRKAGE